MSLTLTNAEKQVRYRERHPGVDGEKVRVGLNLNAGPMLTPWLWYNYISATEPCP
jgi:hypothetical protein